MKRDGPCSKFSWHARCPRQALRLLSPWAKWYEYMVYSKVPACWLPLISSRSHHVYISCGFNPIFCSWYFYFFIFLFFIFLNYFSFLTRIFISYLPCWLEYCKWGVPVRRLYVFGGGFMSVSCMHPCACVCVCVCVSVMYCHTFIIMCVWERVGGGLLSYLIPELF